MVDCKTKKKKKILLIDQILPCIAKLLHMDKLIGR